MGGAEPSTLLGESESLAYSELRRQIVLDELADVVARVAEIPEDSDGQHALRLVASAWAELRGIENEDLFARYDLGFELRRLTFVQHRINDLIRETGGAGGGRGGPRPLVDHARDRVAPSSGQASAERDLRGAPVARAWRAAPQAHGR
jgi:hypothetical protein